MNEEEPKRPHVKDAIRWVTYAFPGIVMVTVICALSPWFMPKEDPLSLVRNLAILVCFLTVGIIGTTGCLIYVDRITPGDWLEKVEHAPYGPTIILVALLLAICAFSRSF
jgi:hypothetical protein